ncbi:MAG: UDP-N-acetylmuramate--L-alanine ligase [Candidatus Omnitrophota bacterium]
MLKHIHFIGIGGIGVSAIAQLALKKADKVTGSDAKSSEITDKLKRLGIDVKIGHDARHVEGADLVVYSSAIPADNPELTAARIQGIPVKKRAEFLNILMAEKTVVTVSGAHGKTTTSSLAARLLCEAGFGPTVAVGGILCEDGDNAKFGQSPYFVAEADESDGSFLLYSPDYSIITNIDEEHMDYFRSRDNLLDSFSRFIHQTKQGGCVFYCRQDAALTSLVVESGVRSVSFGFTPQADFYPEDMVFLSDGLVFNCMCYGKLLGKVVLKLIGRHNVLNAMAVIALGMALGISFIKIRSILADFKGVQRRFQTKYDGLDVKIVDDYAHHPTEIQATLEAASLSLRRRLVVVFQPHRYTRTQVLLDRFARCFYKSDHLVVTDIYAAGEEAISGVDAQCVVDRIRAHVKTPVDYVARSEVVNYLKGVVCQDDLILFLGAGDITKISDEFAGIFKK